MISSSSMVLGKFYPPHVGHHYLIDVAAQNSGRVLVMVLGREDEAVSIATRVSWLSWAHMHQTNVTVVGAVDNVKNDYDDPDIWDQHMVIIKRMLATFTSERPIDAVFSSEEYGDELARRLGVRHIMVDQLRRVVPISATRVRSDPVGHADMLAAHTRAGLAKRVVVVGAESTGTTTLAEMLASAYQGEERTKNTKWVPEYGHTYCKRKLLAEQSLARFDGRGQPEMGDLDWGDEEFVRIAQEQNRLEDEAALNSGLLLLCDTDAWTTSVWQERYMGHVSEEVRDLARHDRALYILTHHDGVAFVQDGTRDGEHIREAMTEVLAARLEKTGSQYIVVRGTPQERVAQAKAKIDELLENGWWSQERKVGGVRLVPAGVYYTQDGSVLGGVGN